MTRVSTSLDMNGEGASRQRSGRGGGGRGAALPGARTTAGGLRPREAQIEAMRESGMKPAAIARALGLKESSVSDVLARLYPSNDGWMSSARRGSERLLARILAVHPEGYAA